MLLCIFFSISSHKVAVSKKRSCRDWIGGYCCVQRKVLSFLGTKMQFSVTLVAWWIIMEPLIRVFGFSLNRNNGHSVGEYSYAPYESWELILSCFEKSNLKWRDKCQIKLFSSAVLGWASEAGTDELCCYLFSKSIPTVLKSAVAM